MARKPVRGKNKDNARRSKKKISILSQERVEYVDYKDVNLLRRFMSDRGKIRARRVTGNDAQQQSAIAMAIKNAREMALLPYANRVTQQRGGRGDRGDRGDRPGLRADGPPPRPTAPPPGPGGAADEFEGDVDADDAFEDPFTAEVEA
jgi:small subunit ribosomal protein S18